MTQNTMGQRGHLPPQTLDPHRKDIVQRAVQQEHRKEGVNGIIQIGMMFRPRAMMALP